MCLSPVRRALSCDGKADADSAELDLRPQEVVEGALNPGLSGPGFTRWCTASVGHMVDPKEKVSIIMLSGFGGQARQGSCSQMWGRLSWWCGPGRSSAGAGGRIRLSQLPRL